MVKKELPKVEIRIFELDSGFSIYRAAVTGKGPSFGGTAEGEETHAVETAEKAGELITKMLKWEET